MPIADEPDAEPKGPPPKKQKKAPPDAPNKLPSEAPDAPNKLPSEAPDAPNKLPSQAPDAPIKLPSDAPDAPNKLPVEASSSAPEKAPKDIEEPHAQAPIADQPENTKDKKGNKNTKDVVNSKPEQNNVMPAMPDRAEGEIWWCEELTRALRQHTWGVERSKPLFVDGEAVCTTFEYDNLKWVVPHLIPSDLAKYNGGKLVVARVPPKNASPCKSKKRNPASSSSCPPYVLDVVRVCLAKQGQGNPIVKVQVRQDRNDLKSKWVQRMQVVIKEPVTEAIAYNVAKSFADCFQFMGMAPSETDYRECRDALLAYGAAGHHDFEKGPLPWQKVQGQLFKSFPPKYLGTHIRRHDSMHFLVIKTPGCGSTTLPTVYCQAFKAVRRVPEEEEEGGQGGQEAEGWGDQACGAQAPSSQRRRG